LSRARFDNPTADSIIPEQLFLPAAENLAAGMLKEVGIGLVGDAATLTLLTLGGLAILRRRRKR
jgi:hypothetical protein